MTGKKNLAIGAVLIAIIVVSGVGYLLLPPASTSKTTLVVGIHLAIGRFLHPLTVNGGDDAPVLNVFEGLFQIRNDVMAVEPLLATDWGNVSADGLEYTFTLRQGIRFHDGTPFNASCVKAHFDSMFTYGAGMTYYYTATLLNSTYVIDDYTVKFKLNYPSTSFTWHLGNIAGYIPSPTAIETYGIDNINDHPVGTGPFKFVSRVPDQEVVVEANRDWWQLNHGEVITVDEVIWTQVADAATLAIALQNGEVDLMDGRLNNEDYHLLSANPNLVRYDISSSSSRRWLTFTMNDTVWDVFPNKTMRQAFAYAIPYDEIIEVGLSGYGQRQYSLLAPEHPNYMPVGEKYEYNTTKALELIAEGGFTPPVAVTLHITPTHYGVSEVNIAALIKERALPAGFDVSIVQEEYTSFKTRYQKTSEQEMCLWSWAANPEIVWFDMFMRSNTWGPGYSEALGGDMAVLYPYVDDLITEATGTTNSTRYSEICVELQELWAEWLPNIWIWREVTYRFARSNIQNLVYGPTFYVYHLHDVIKT